VKGSRGREEKEGGEGKGAYRDEGPLTKILNTPLSAVDAGPGSHGHVL